MALTYYTDYPASLRVEWTSEDPAPPPPVGLHVATPAELADIEEDSEKFIAFHSLIMKVTRSTIRNHPVQLQGETLDDGRSYAVFIEDQPVLAITEVEFVLDEIHHNTEFSAPWDFNGTDVGDEAIKFTFTPGTHEIDAHITYDGGMTTTITSTFEVD